MKAIVFFALIAFSQAAHLFYYAGTTNTTTGGASPTALFATVDVNGVCAPGAVLSGYQKFTINSTINPGPTFYWITALFERTTFATAQVQVYNGNYDPLAPCANFSILGDATSRAPHVSILAYLTPGFHDVVVTTTDPTDAGVFAVHADRAMWTAGTTNASPYMLQQYTSSSTCQTYSGGSPYTYYQWTAAATATVDIIVFSYNNTDINNDWVASLYNTSTLAWLGTGNVSVPADGCVTNNNWVDAQPEETSYTKISQDYYAAGIFVAVSQVAGQNYTLVVSGYNTQDNYIYGAMIRPTTRGFLGTTSNYYRPSFGSIAEGECSNGTTTYYWFPIVFTAQYSTYVVDNGNSAGGLDTAACLYYGNNEGSPNQLVPPVPCSANWLQCIDTGDIGPLHQLGTTPGQNYTIVQTTYSSSAGNGAEYTLYIYTGVQLGPLPITTTGAPIVTTGTATSSASAIVASFAMLLAALLF